jgi:hypothetical protein
MDQDPLIDMEAGQEYFAPNREMGDEEHIVSNASDNEENSMCGQWPPSYKLLECEQVWRALERRQARPIQHWDSNTASDRRSQGRPQLALLSQVQNH